MRVTGKETDSGFFYDVRFSTESFCLAGFEGDKPGGIPSPLGTGLVLLARPVGKFHLQTCFPTAPARDATFLTMGTIGVLAWERQPQMAVPPLEKFVVGGAGGDDEGDHPNKM